MIDNTWSLKFTDEGFYVKYKKTRAILTERNRINDLYTLERDLHKALAVTKAEKNSDTNP